MVTGFSEEIMHRPPTRWERVAQPVEHLTFNQRVPGSNPGALTKENKDLHKSKRFLGSS